MQYLLLDREEDGTAFTWLNLGRVWGLAFALTWQAHGGGGSGITLADAMSMTPRVAVAWRGWIQETREAEAAAIRRARESAQSGGGR